MDWLIILIVLLRLLGGGGGLYGRMGTGWGIGPMGPIVAVIVVAYLLCRYRGQTRPRTVARSSQRIVVSRCRTCANPNFVEAVG